MIRLVPMTESEFDTFIEISMRDQAQGKIEMGVWRVEEADALIRKQCEQLLPNGLATPNHFFFTLEDTDLAAKVGSFWYAIVEIDGQTRFFVMDIQVDPQYRRRGYGTQVFRIMEENAREMGITTISLHVFEENYPARAMYEKLGYTGPSDLMSKELSID